MAAAKATKRSRKNGFPQFYLGVDGGGTKTHVAVLNEARETVGEGATNHGDVIDTLGEVRIQIGNLNARLPPLLECPTCTQQGSWIACLQQRILF